MGRLTLNILLSFAQFEREVIGERIRDKFEASRKKGMWMGGYVPLGYRVENRKLLIDDSEAATVRLIFERFLQLGSATFLARELLAKGVTTRRGKLIDKGYLYKLLRNRVYLGEAVHKGTSYPGEHRPITAAICGTTSILSCARVPRRAPAARRRRRPRCSKGWSSARTVGQCRPRTRAGAADCTGIMLANWRLNAAPGRARSHVYQRRKSKPRWSHRYVDYCAHRKSAVATWRAARQQIDGLAESEVRDALTHFDECGIVVLSSCPELLALLQGFAWKEIFVERREEVCAHMCFVVFGHATYDSLLKPFRGLTAKAIHYTVDEAWLAQTPEEQIPAVDRLLAADFSAGRHTRPRDLHPLPLLGIPGVTPESENPDYYDDTWQFRPVRRPSN